MTGTGASRTAATLRRVDVGEHLEALEREGIALGRAAEATTLDAAVPTCPGWTVRDLVHHMGDVHRWAATHVAERRTERVRDLPALFGPLPDDEHLLSWYRDGHAHLMETLTSADPDVRCWSFLPAPSPLAFWARRQAHETSIHRADADGASGRIGPFEPAFAADGIDELLFGFFGRAPKADGTPEEPRVARTLRLRADDADREWVLRITDGTVITTTNGGQELSDGSNGGGNCAVQGSASDLYLLMWNRRSEQGLDVSGDTAVLEEWRSCARITWGGGGR